MMITFVLEALIGLLAYKLITPTLVIARLHTTAWDS